MCSCSWGGGLGDPSFSRFRVPTSHQALCCVVGAGPRPVTLEWPSAAASWGQLSGSALPGKGGFGPRRLRVLPSLPLFSPLSSEPDWTEGAVLTGGSRALEELSQSFACVSPEVLGSFRALPHLRVRCSVTLACLLFILW